MGAEELAEHRCLDWRLGLARCLALRARPGSNKQPLKQPLEPSQKPNRYEDMSMNMTCHMSMHMDMDMDMHNNMYMCMSNTPPLDSEELEQTRHVKSHTGQRR